MNYFKFLYFKKNLKKGLSLIMKLFRASRLRGKSESRFISPIWKMYTVCIFINTRLISNVTHTSFMVSPEVERTWKLAKVTFSLFKCCVSNLNTTGVLIKTRGWIHQNKRKRKCQCVLFFIHKQWGINLGRSCSN